MKYTVLKQHLGDKQYYAGDIREVKREDDAKKLKEMGLIAEIKAAKPLQNKAKQPHKNK